MTHGPWTPPAGREQQPFAEHRVPPRGLHPPPSRHTPTITPIPRRDTPLVDFDAAGGVDLNRLERGLALHAARVGIGRYRVTGGDQDHWVDLFTAAHPRCDCGDHVWREQVCKHILAALLREGDARVVAALGAVVARARAAAAPVRPARKAA